MMQSSRPAGGVLHGGQRRCSETFHEATTRAAKPVGRRCVVTSSSKGLVEECSSSNWRTPLKNTFGTPSSSPDIIVALGKFDALHLGHRSLAIRAAKMGGQPCLLSFSGMAEVLGWPIRQPLVASCDRPRVLKSWEDACQGRCPRQRSVPFHEIRSMSPEEFVRLLAVDLQAVGVVAGSNYRFGYKAAGDADTLRQLGSKYGLQISIVDLLEDPEGTRQQQAQVLAHQALLQGGHRAAAVAPAASKQDLVRQYVSSTKARELLSRGDVGSVATLLGRQYRLVASLDSSAPQCLARCRVPALGGSSFPSASPRHKPQFTAVLPSRTLLNKPPACGVYEASMVVAVREEDGGGADGNGRSHGVLPLDLESGVGMPLTVEIAPDGIHVCEEALEVAVSAAVQHKLDRGSTPLPMYAVLDLCDLVTLH